MPFVVFGTDEMKGTVTDSVLLENNRASPSSIYLAAIIWTRHRLLLFPNLTGCTQG